MNSPQAAQMEEKHLEIQTPRGVGEDDYNEEDFELDEERPPRSVPKLKDLSLEYLLTMSSHEVQLLLKKLGFQHYTKRVHEMGVTGRDLANCNEFDLNLMGLRIDRTE